MGLAKDYLDAVRLNQGPELAVTTYQNQLSIFCWKGSPQG